MHKHRTHLHLLSILLVGSTLALALPWLDSDARTYEHDAKDQSGTLASPNSDDPTDLKAADQDVTPLFYGWYGIYGGYGAYDQPTTTTAPSIPAAIFTVQPTTTITLSDNDAAYSTSTLAQLTYPTLNPSEMPLVDLTTTMWLDELPPFTPTFQPSDVPSLVPTTTAIMTLDDPKAMQPSFSTTNTTYGTTASILLPSKLESSTVEDSGYSYATTTTAPVGRPPPR